MVTNRCYGMLDELATGRTELAALAEGLLVAPTPAEELVPLPTPAAEALLVVPALVVVAAPVPAAEADGDVVVPTVVRGEELAFRPVLVLVVPAPLTELPPEVLLAPVGAVVVVLGVTPPHSDAVAEVVPEAVIEAPATVQFKGTGCSMIST
ncbi:MAG: hypothetical protein JO247_21460 [Chloroflexi bacterium]|nr:hypothetical protein [Chloroflexota bacterium]